MCEEEERKKESERERQIGCVRASVPDRSVDCRRQQRPSHAPQGTRPLESCWLLTHICPPMACNTETYPTSKFHYTYGHDFTTMGTNDYERHWCDNKRNHDDNHDGRRTTSIMWRNSLEEKTSHVHITVSPSVQLQLPTGLRHIQLALQNSMTYYFEMACGQIATLVLSNRSSCYLHCSPGCGAKMKSSHHHNPHHHPQGKRKEKKRWNYE